MFVIWITANVERLLLSSVLKIVHSIKKLYQEDDNKNIGRICVPPQLHINTIP